MSGSNVGATSCGCGQECNCTSIANENAKQLHTLKNLILDANMKLDELMEIQLNQQIQPQAINENVVLEEVIEEAFAVISSKVDLDKLEQDLVVTEHYRSIKSGLMKRIKSVGIKARLHDALYLVFNRIFLSECSWSGIGRSGPKIEFRKYVHILQLFKEISGSRDYSEVEKFFSTKLRNAGTAAKRTGVVKSVSRGQYSKKKTCNIKN